MTKGQYEISLYELLDKDLVTDELRAFAKKHSGGHISEFSDIDIMAGAMKVRVIMGIRTDESIAWLYEHNYTPL